MDRTPRLAIALVAIVLIAGCSQSVDPPPLRARATELQVPPSDEYPGVVVRGSIGVDGDSLRVQASARNDGPRTYKVEAGCTTPWREELYHGDDSAPFRQPQAQCEAFALASFEPGQTIAYDVSWDGRVWDDDSNRLVKAPPGDYTWSVRFVAYRGDDSISAKRFDLDFAVTVLPS